MNTKRALKPVRTPLDSAAWLLEARKLLIEGGVGAVKIGHLAAKLDVSRESFYWHFRNLDTLLNALIADWKSGNSAGYLALIDPEHRDGHAEFDALNQMWVDEKGYDPAWDAVMRDWARVSAKVARAVMQVDEMRIDLIRQMFLHMGLDELTALVRARIAYFHQVGYYTTDLGEPREERLRLHPLYVRFLTGDFLQE